MGWSSDPGRMGGGRQGAERAASIVGDGRCMVRRVNVLVILPIVMLGTWEYLISR